MADTRDTPGVERADDDALRNDIDQEQEKLAQAEHREEIIRERIKRLMMRGEKYDPMSYANFFEAIDNAAEMDRNLIWNLIFAADKRRYDDDFRNRTALVAISNTVFDYWERIARVVVTEQVDRLWDGQE